MFDNNLSKSPRIIGSASKFALLFLAMAKKAVSVLPFMQKAMITWHHAARHNPIDSFAAVVAQLAGK